MLHVIISTSAASRLTRATRFLAERSPADEVLVIGASRGAADARAALFQLASQAWRDWKVPWAGLPVALIDVAINSRAEQRFVEAVVTGTATALATVPDGDVRTLDVLAALGARIEEVEDA